MAKILGWSIVKGEPTSQTDQFAPPDTDDGAKELVDSSIKSTLFDLSTTVDSEAQLISRYRDLSLQPEVESAIEDIVNEMIVPDPDGSDNVVQINLDSLPEQFNEQIKELLRKTFDEVLRLLDFNNHAFQIARRWYIDGRIAFYCSIDKDHVENGIRELQYIDPRKLKKVRKIVQVPDKSGTGAQLVKRVEEFFIYRNRGIYETATTYTVPAGALKIAGDSMVFVTSGLMDSQNHMSLSYLHKALKPLNQLRSLEDASIINKLVRAPMRRIFGVEVGSLPKAKGQQYIRNQMANYKNRLTYDSSSGKIKDARHFMTMLEDFWIPVRDGQPIIKIDNLPGADTWENMQDLQYFRENLYRALGIPISRLQPDSPFNIGRPSEITRDEVKFARFIRRLRQRFSQIFEQAMTKQLVLKHIASEEICREIFAYVKFDYREDNFFSELKESEIENGRFAMLANVAPFVGKYVSMDWVRRNILHQDDDEIEKQLAFMSKERQAGLYNIPTADEQIGMAMASAAAIPPQPPADAAGDAAASDAPAQPTQGAPAGVDTTNEPPR